MSIFREDESTLWCFSCLWYSSCTVMQEYTAWSHWGFPFSTEGQLWSFITFRRPPQPSHPSMGSSLNLYWAPFLGFSIQLACPIHFPVDVKMSHYNSPVKNSPLPLPSPPIQLLSQGTHKGLEEVSKKDNEFLWASIYSEGLKNSLNIHRVKIKPHYFPSHHLYLLWRHGSQAWRTTICIFPLGIRAQM